MRESRDFSSTLVNAELVVWFVHGLTARSFQLCFLFLSSSGPLTATAAGGGGAIGGGVAAAALAFLWQ